VDDDSFLLVDDSAFFVDVESVLVVDEPLSDEPLSDEPLSDEPLSDEPLSDEPLSEVDDFEPVPPWSFL
jgi:hypothetical protein